MAALTEYVSTEAGTVFTPVVPTNGDTFYCDAADRTFLFVENGAATATVITITNQMDCSEHATKSTHDASISVPAGETWMIWIPKMQYGDPTDSYKVTLSNYTVTALVLVACIQMGPYTT